MPPSHSYDHYDQRRRYCVTDPDNYDDYYDSDYSDNAPIPKTKPLKYPDFDVYYDVGLSRYPDTGGMENMNGASRVHLRQEIDKHRGVRLASYDWLLEQGRPKPEGKGKGRARVRGTP